MKKLIFIITIVIAALILYMKIRIDSHSGVSLQIPQFETAEVTRSAISSGIQGRGKIDPKRLINLTSTLDGQIKEILVAEGDEVKKNQCLATIGAQPQIQLKLLNLKNRFLKNDMDKEELTEMLEFQNKLFAEGMTTKVEIEKLKRKKTWVEENESALDSERKLLEKQLGSKLSKSALLKSNITTLTDGCLQASIAGTVLQINYQEGDFVSTMFNMNTPPFMVIGDLSQYLIHYKVSEIDLSKIKIGQPVDITLDSWPEKIFQGVVDSIGSISALEQNELGPFSSPTHQLSKYIAKISLTDTVPELRPGLSCMVFIRTVTKKDILVVPVAAVYTAEADKQFVFFKQGEEYQPRVVETGIGNVDFVEVLSGLQEGETVSLAPYKIIEHRKIIKAARSKTFLEKILN